MKNTKTQASIKFAISAILTILVLATFVYSSGTTLTINIDKLEETDYTTITMYGQLASGSVPIEGAKIGIIADDGNGTHIFADELTTNAAGNYMTHFKLENTKTGSYTVYASASTTQAGSVTVKKYFSIGECTEDWTCTSWSTCNSNSQQTRTCTDNNKCGTEEYKPAETRGCTPTCSTLGGHICSSQETCQGSYIDASDSDRCCDSTCKSSGSTGTSSNTGASTQPSPAEENETATETTEEEAPVNDTIIADEDINETGNTTAVIAPKTNESGTIADNQKTSQAPTGRFISAISKSRWLIVNITLIILILILGKKLASKGAKEDDSGRRYSFRPKQRSAEFKKIISNMAGIISLSNAAPWQCEDRGSTGAKTSVAKLRVVMPDND